MDRTRHASSRLTSWTPVLRIRDDRRAPGWRADTRWTMAAALLAASALWTTNVRAQVVVGLDPTCFENCDLEFNEGMERCFTLEDPDAVEECLLQVQFDMDRCIRSCEPGEECFLDCELAFEEALRACDDDPTGECFAAAQEALEACTLECLPEEARCVVDCDRAHATAVDACDALDDPDARAECLANADEALLGCYRECGGRRCRPVFAKLRHRVLSRTHRMRRRGRRTGGDHR